MAGARFDRPVSGGLGSMLTLRPKAGGKIMRFILPIYIYVSMVIVSAMALADPLILEVADARAGEQWAGDHVVFFVLKEKSGRDFAEFTRKHINKHVVFRIDGQEIMNAIVRSEIPGGRGVISVRNANEAINVAERLNSGKANFEVEEGPAAKN